MRSSAGIRDQWFDVPEFAIPAVARRYEQRLATVEAYAEARLELGEPRELVAELGEEVRRHVRAANPSDSRQDSDQNENP